MRLRNRWQLRTRILGVIAIFTAVTFAIVTYNQAFSNVTPPKASLKLDFEIESDNESGFNVEPIRPLVATVALDSEKVQLGKTLFNDRSLSGNNTLSCASCHDVSNGGDDDRVSSIGIKNQVGPINAPTVVNSVFNANYFWDGRSSSLVDQVAGPIHNEIEMGSNWTEVIAKLTRNPDRVKAFKQVYGSSINAGNIADAIAEYERALVSIGSPFDLYLQGHPEAITRSAKRGYTLFKEVGCVSCHQGQNVGSNAFQQFGVMGDYFTNRGNITSADYGRFNVTGRESDKHYFKVPTLRNIDLTAPYFHDGNAKTLAQAVRTMARYQLGFELSHDEVADIVEFLRSLTASLPEPLI